MGNKDAERLLQFAFLFHNLDEDSPGASDLSLHRFYRQSGRPLLSVDQLRDQYPHNEERLYILTEYDRFTPKVGAERASGTTDATA